MGRTRRAASLTSLTLLFGTIGALGFSASSQALICSTTYNCYAAANANYVQSNYGMFGDVLANCLYQPDDGGFNNAEIWDTQHTVNYWTEAGLTSGKEIASPYTYHPNKTWFWADIRPGQNYIEQFPTTANAGTGVYYSVEIKRLAANQWHIYEGNNFTDQGTSAQTADLDVGSAGAEYTGNSGDGFRSKGQVADLERLATNGTWYPWGAVTQSPKFGFFKGTWDSATQTESWAGPC